MWMLEFKLFQLMDIDILWRIKNKSEIELPSLPLGEGDGHDDVVPGGEADQLAVLPHVGQHWAHQRLVILSVLRVQLGSWLFREYRRYMCALNVSPHVHWELGESQIP